MTMLKRALPDEKMAAGQCWKWKIVANKLLRCSIEPANMALWLTRAGSHGEYEQKFLRDKRIYITRENLSHDLSVLRTREELIDILSSVYPSAKLRTMANWASQIWQFAHDARKGDLAILPLKASPVIYVGEILGDYHFDPVGPNPFFHWRPVRWIAEGIPRTNFSEDLLESFGSFMAICRIQRNNAEARIIAMRANGWRSEPAIRD